MRIQTCANAWYSGPYWVDMFYVPTFYKMYQYVERSILSSISLLWYRAYLVWFIINSMRQTFLPTEFLIQIPLICRKITIVWSKPFLWRSFKCLISFESKPLNIKSPNSHLCALFWPLLVSIYIYLLVLCWMFVHTSVTEFLYEYLRKSL